MPPRKTASSTEQRRISLPEEILRDILIYNLVLSHDAFAGPQFSVRRNGQLTLFETMSKSRVGDKRVRSSPVDLLLVCKQWLRIGTPLLYEAIVISHYVRMIALAEALRASPQIGSHIRRLKAMDGFGKEFLAVITRAPNLHTLGLTMDIPSSRNVKGLTAALPLLQPSCFLLSARYYPQNKNVATVQEAFELAIPKWTSLNRVILNSGLSPWLTAALRKVPSLRYISLDEHYLAYDQEEHSQSLYGRGWSGNLKRIANDNADFAAVLCRAKDPSLQEKSGRFKTPNYRVILLDERSMGESFTTTVS